MSGDRPRGFRSGGFGGSFSAGGSRAGQPPRVPSKAAGSDAAAARADQAAAPEGGGPVRGVRLGRAAASQVADAETSRKRRARGGMRGQRSGRGKRGMTPGTCGPGSMAGGGPARRKDPGARSALRTADASFTAPAARCAGSDLRFMRAAGSRVAGLPVMSTARRCPRRTLQGRQKDRTRRLCGAARGRYCWPEPGALRRGLDPGPEGFVRMVGGAGARIGMACRRAGRSLPPQWAEAPASPGRRGRRVQAGSGPVTRAQISAQCRSRQPRRKRAGPSGGARAVRPGGFSRN